MVADTGYAVKTAGGARLLRDTTVTGDTADGRQGGGTMQCIVGWVETANA
jgi:hypothetical protein